MKVHQLAGYERSIYFVSTMSEWLTMTRWCRENDVICHHWVSSQSGYGFKISKNFEWFALRWL